MPGGGDPMTALINSAARGSTGPSSSSSSSSSRGIFGAASTGLSRMQLEQVIGVSAMAGTSLLVFKIAMYAVRNNNDNKDNNNNKNCNYKFNHIYIYTYTCTHIHMFCLLFVQSSLLLFIWKLLYT